MLSPIVSEAPTFALVINGQNSVVLTNPFREAMLVDELRFHLSLFTGSPFTIMLDAFRARVRIGRQLLTSDYVPIGLLCRPTDWWSQAAPASVRIFSPDGSYAWRFDKPIYLPAEGQIEVDCRLIDGFAGAAGRGSQLFNLTEVNIAMAGRSLSSDEPVPETIDLPYCAKWQPAAVPGSSGAGGAIVPLVAVSGLNDLVNPHPETLNLTRFTGYLLTQIQTDAFTFPVVFDGFGAADACRVRVYRSDGGFGVRDQTPLFTLLSAGTRSWRAKGALLPKREYFIADVDFTQALAGTFASVFALGMQGRRVIPAVELGVNL